MAIGVLVLSMTIAALVPGSTGAFICVCLGFAVVGSVIEWMVMWQIYGPAYFYMSMYGCGGAIFYGVYLLVATFLMISGQGGAKVDPDDYVLGVILLYIEIIILFLYLLALLASRKR